MNQTEKFTFRTNARLLQRMDYCAQKMGLSRNQLMNNLLACGTDDLLILDKVGLLSLGAGIRDLISLAHNPDDMGALDFQRSEL